MIDRALLKRLTLRGARKVPEITVYFWVIKALSTAMGESTSDYLVHAMAPRWPSAWGSSASSRPSRGSSRCAAM